MTRINQYVARATGLSRRVADKAVSAGRVQINGHTAKLGDNVAESDVVQLDGQPLGLPSETVTIILNKPVGYVCSRRGQGNPTIYKLLPPEYQGLKPVGRLDKDSSGLLLMTNDGELSNRLMHPRYGKTKVYEIGLDKPLAPLHQQLINDRGIALKDGPSRLQLMKLADNGMSWQVIMREGRNRQIRRTFAALGYKVVKLRRVQFGDYYLQALAEAEHRLV